MNDQRVARLKVVSHEVGICVGCDLSESRSRTVFSRGNPFAEIMFVGPSPGAEEEAEGESGLGPNGKVLDKLITAMGLIDGDYYITDAVKCRVLGKGLEDLGKSAEACKIFLLTQINLIRPRVIVTLGTAAADTLFGRTTELNEWNETVVRGELYPVMPTHLPAEIVGDPEKKKAVGQALLQVLGLLGKKPPQRGS